MSNSRTRIAELEAQLVGDPDSRELREELLQLYGDRTGFHDPRRVEHVIWYVRSYPRESIARCPFVYIDKDTSRVGFDEVERLWRAHVAASPSDPLIVLGLASFLAPSDREQAIRVLRDFVAVHAGYAEVWVDLGRYCLGAAQRLSSFQQARSLGSDHPNLTAWIARSAIEANDVAAAKAAADELLANARELRDRYGDNLDIDARGGNLWERALALTTSRSEARRLVDAISSYANHTHWAHTTLGVIALRARDLEGAIDQLAQIGSRLSRASPVLLRAVVRAREGALRRRRMDGGGRIPSGVREVLGRRQTPCAAKRRGESTHTGRLGWCGLTPSYPRTSSGSLCIAALSNVVARVASRE